MPPPVGPLSMGSEAPAAALYMYTYICIHLLVYTVQRATAGRLRSHMGNPRNEETNP